MAAAAVLYVQDLGRVSAFYERCLGMSPAVSGGRFRVLASGDWELSLVLMPAAVAAAVAITDPPGRREDSPVKLAFEVASIEELRPVVSETGGRLDPVGSAWEFRGQRHLDCLDPEGNVVQLRQRTTTGRG
jgi:predicted enzyme related to lactoylglutathione lyase